MKLPKEHPWQTVKAARIPWAELPSLGALRDRPDVLVHKQENYAWIRWGESQRLVIECLLGVSQVAFFIRKGNVWFPFGRLVPTEVTPPDHLGEPIAIHLSPIAPDVPMPLATNPGKIAWNLVPGGTPQPARGLVCDHASLLKWAETATTVQIERLKAAWNGNRVIIEGEPLPVISGSTRFWGDRVWIPLGWVGEPPFSETFLLEAANLESGEILLCQDSNREVIPLQAFGPLTRAGIKLVGEKLNQIGESP